MDTATTLYYRLHPAKFLEDVGGKLRRGKISPDPWQHRVMECRSKRILLLTNRQAGKTSCMAALALWHTLLFDDQLVLLVAPTERQSKILFARVARFYRALGGVVDTTSARRLGFEFANGSQIEALPGTAATIQGYSANLVLCDEAGALNDDVVAVLMPSLAVTDGALVLASKPYQPRGTFFDLWHRGEGWYRERVRATEVPRITPSFLEEQRSQLLSWQFAREYMCEWPQETNSVFGPASLFEENTVDIPPLWDQFGNYQPIQEDPETADLEKTMADIERELARLREGRNPSLTKDDELLAGTVGDSWWKDWYSR